MISRRVASGLPVNGGIANGSPDSFSPLIPPQCSPGEPLETARGAGQSIHKSDPLPGPSNSTERPYWKGPLGLDVKYASGNPHDIHQVLASITDKSTLLNTIIILKDLDDPRRPLFLITTLRSKWFPGGNWQAYLYHARSLFTDDYHLIGKLTIAIEPRLIPPWQTWRFLSRHIRQLIDPSNKRRPRAGKGLLIASEPRTTE